MELVGGLLGGLGILGIVGGVCLGFVTLLLLPWWAILDCAFSRRSAGLKVVGVVLLVITWGLGSLIYGLFATTSRVLRVVTAVAFGGVLLLLVTGGVSLIAGAGVHGKLRSEEERRERDAIVAQFRPGALPARDLAAFEALHFTFNAYGHATTALARFDAGGPDFDSARDTERAVRQVACDGGRTRCWALTDHDFGAVDPSSGRFTRIEVDASLANDLSWPKGIAFDSNEQKVYVMTCGVFTKLYRFDPATRAWEVLPAEIRGLSVVNLTYSSSDRCLYATEHEAHDPALRRLQRFNTSGASLGPIDLAPAIPIGDAAEDLFQIQASGDKLVLILPPETTASSANRVFVVDPRTGEVLVPAPG